MNKICTKCKQDKSFDDFTNDKRAKDGKHSQCKLCVSSAMKEYYRKKPEIVKKQNWDLMMKIYGIVNEIKTKSGCKFCPEKEAVCLDFHHLNPKEKTDNISNLIRKKSLPKVLVEIEKCIIVCANCHRKLHEGILKI